MAGRGGGEYYGGDFYKVKLFAAIDFGKSDAQARPCLRRASAKLKRSGSAWMPGTSRGMTASRREFTQVATLANFIPAWKAGMTASDQAATLFLEAS
jgi:hypothetical protein